MGPSPRRREKDRETPPPPPPLYDPNMAPRRKGQRDSPGIDAERKRRDRYTPSPPPPPPDAMVPPRRRRRPTPSSSPPPPPPPGHMLPPRGMGLPPERSSSPPPPPPAHAFSPSGMRLPQQRPPPRGGPPSMNAPLPRPPQDMMAPRPLGNGAVSGPVGNPPPRGYTLGMGMQRPVFNPRIAGTSTPGNMRGPPPPINNSPLRGMRPQADIPNEQSPMYINSSLGSNTSGDDSDRPPPPPVFANGPYSKTPPGRIRTLPSSWYVVMMIVHL